jgi:hypothetical protein
VTPETEGRPTGRWIRWQHLAWPGVAGAGLVSPVLLLHALWRRPASPDLFSVACFVLILVSLTMCFVGTLGRIDAERRR